MAQLTVVHLVDDTTPGGVMRMVHHLTRQPGLNDVTRQSIIDVKRGSAAIDRIAADVIISHLTVNWRGLPKLICLRAMNPSARLIHVEHSYTHAFTALNVPNKRRFFALLRVAYSLFDTVVAVSYAQADWLRARKLVDAPSLEVIHPEVDLTPFKSLPSPQDTPRTIGAIGRLERQKGFDMLIEAFRLCRTPGARLLVFGDGQEKSRLQALAAGDVRVVFCGHAVNPEDAYKHVDIVAVPSRWEAFGLVVQEAKAAKRPVILSPKDGLRDQIDGTTIVADPIDVQTFARVLDAAMADGDFSAHTDVSAQLDKGEAYAARWLAVMKVDKTPNKTSMTA